MILDKEAELVTTVAFDLDAVNPGPGNPIKLMAIGVGAPLVITTGATDTAADACMTVDASETVEFELPSNTLQFIMATFATGEVVFILPGAQTNK